MAHRVNKNPGLNLSKSTHFHWLNLSETLVTCAYNADVPTSERASERSERGSNRTSRVSEQSERASERAERRGALRSE